MTEIKVLKVIYKKKCHQAIAKHEKLMDLVNFSCHPFLIFCQMADNKIKILINWQLLFLRLSEVIKLVARCYYRLSIILCKKIYYMDYDYDV